MSIFDNMLKVANNKYAQIVSDGNIADVDTWVDTGSYSLNALVSGSIFKGIPCNKTVVLAGEPAVGKTFYLMNIVRQFLLDNEDGFVFLFESESAVTTDMLTTRGIDASRVAIIPVVTVEEMRSQATRMLDEYTRDAEAHPEKRKQILYCLDSLGSLSTNKEVGDITISKDVKDMTKPGLIRGMFRVLDLKLGLAKVPMVVTNHTYEQIGAYVPTSKQSGGQGSAYGADNVIFLKKSKSRDDKTKEVTGVIVTCTNNKSRLTIENKSVETYLDYQKGLDRYYGLLDIAIKYDIIKQEGKFWVGPGGLKAAKKEYLEWEGEKYFNKEVLKAIDEACQKEFTYGGNVAKST
jgi:hypothetical protein